MAHYGKNYLEATEPTKDGMWYVYVLKCENDCYYIGIALDIKKRYLMHINGYGADFTKTNKPIKIIEKVKTNTNVKGLAEIIENYKMLEYVKKYSVKKVGGGSYKRQGMLNNAKKRIMGNIKPADYKNSLAYKNWKANKNKE